MSGVDLVQWLTAALNEEAEDAQRAFSGQADPENGWGAYRPEGQRHTTIVPHVGMIHEAVQADHIVRWNPARVLREVEAKRQLLADVLTEAHFRNEEDNWYACAALTDEGGDPVCLDDSRAPGPCDCGRDARVVRRVRLLALPYEGRPGYAEAIASAE